MRSLFLREKTVDMKVLGDSLHIVHGSLQSDNLTLFTLVRDELFFMPAFIDYHRKIGIDQFLVFDDGSQDGTREYLEKQDDVIIICCDLRFGDRVKNENGRIRRVGVVLKELIPTMFLMNQFHVYLDADEFLFLPPQVEVISDVLKALETEGRKGIAASLVEFFPESIEDWVDCDYPQTLDELINQCPYFEPHPLIKCTEYGDVLGCGMSKSYELFRNYISKKPISYINTKDWLLRKRLRLTSSKKKVPIAYNGNGIYRNGSHEITAPVSSNILLTIGHFVFTRNFKAKVNCAIQHRGHAKRGAKYNAYDLLIRRLEESDGRFLSEKSTRLLNVSQFIEAGLMRWSTEFEI